MGHLKDCRQRMQSSTLSLHLCPKNKNRNVVCPIRLSNGVVFLGSLTRSRARSATRPENGVMSTKSRQVIYGSRIQGAEISAKYASKVANEAAREADRAEAAAWSIRTEGYGGPAQPSPTIAQCINGGLGWLEVRCLGCDTNQTVALDVVRRPKHTPIHELERYMRCKDCSKLRGYPYKRSALVALRPTKISASDPPSTWWRESDEQKPCQTRGSAPRRHFRRRRYGHSQWPLGLRRGRRCFLCLRRGCRLDLASQAYCRGDKARSRKSRAIHRHSRTVCNLYSITTNQAAIVALFRVINRYVGNLAPMPSDFPDYPAPVIRNTDSGTELAMTRWGMPPSPRTEDRGRTLAMLQDAGCYIASIQRKSSIYRRSDIRVSKTERLRLC
jgi:hypothetical protein